VFSFKFDIFVIAIMQRSVWPMTPDLTPYGPGVKRIYYWPTKAIILGGKMCQVLFFVRISAFLSCYVLCVRQVCSPSLSGYFDIYHL